MLRLLLAACLLLAWSSMAIAMSDAEYKQMYSSSDYFRKADDELTRTWKDVYGNLTGEDKKNLLRDQRDWLKNQRDEQARDLMEKGIRKDCAYARVAHRRTGNLRVFEYNANLSQEDKDAGRARADYYFYDEDEDNMPPECLKGK